MAQNHSTNSGDVAAHLPHDGARDQGDVWHHDRPVKNDLHPTMKPVGLVERAIRNSSKSRDTVLDPFAGSGTTLMAAEAMGRRAALIELDPAYCDVIVQRWQDGTGQVARLEESGLTIEEARKERVIDRALPLGAVS